MLLECRSDGSEEFESSRYCSLRYKSGRKEFVVNRDPVFAIDCQGRWNVDIVTVSDQLGSNMSVSDLFSISKSVLGSICQILKEEHFGAFNKLILSLLKKKSIVLIGCHVQSFVLADKYLL